MRVAAPATTRIPIDDGTLVDLRKHLQAATDLELWTIPLYLTALASIELDASRIALPPRGALSETSFTNVTRLLVSTALQEMYHLQLGGNITRGFGEVPRLEWPVYKGRIPYITEVPAGVTVALGTANDLNTLKLLRAVEAPDSSSDEPLNWNNPNWNTPDVPAYKFICYDAEGQPCYPSIGTLYSVIVQLANRFREHFNGGSPQIANGLFSDWYQKTGVIQLSSLDDAINIIVEQGEGAIGEQTAPIDSIDAIPDQRAYEDPFFAENNFSHYERFGLALENNAEGVTVWPTGTGQTAPAQGHLSVIFKTLVENLRKAWSGARPDLGPMFLFRSALAQVYTAGEIPSFAPVGSDSPTYDASVAAVAPPDGATWDRHVKYFFTYTEIEGMKANAVGSPKLDDQASVAANQATIVAVTKNAQMPPGELNVWTPAQVESFAGWKRQ